MAELRVPTGGDPWVGSISIGFAVRSEEMSDLNALMKASDRGVYAVKEVGGDCVRQGT